MIDNYEPPPPPPPPDRDTSHHFAHFCKDCFVEFLDTWEGRYLIDLAVQRAAADRENDL